MDLSASFALDAHFPVSREDLNLTDEANDQFIDTDSNRVVVYTRTRAGSCSWALATGSEFASSALRPFLGSRRRVAPPFDPALFSETWIFCDVRAARLHS